MEENLNDVSLEELEEAEASNATADFPWVLFSIDNVIYGVFSAHVLSIEILGDSTPMVNSPAYIRGITDFRGDMISLIDMRSLFNLPNRYQQLKDELTPRIDAHKTWISTLEECVAQKRHFPLAVDPHNCAFGKWYYSFKTTNSILDMQLKKIESPHSHLHTTAGRIVQLMAENKYEEVEQLMAEQIRPTYDETMKLLEGVLPAYESGIRDMIVVLEVDGIVKGFIVDEIESVEYINRILEMEELNNKTEYIRHLGKREKDNSTVQIINEEKIIRL